MPSSHESRITHVANELIGNGNLTIINDAFSADYVAHASGKQHRGQAFLKRFSGQLRASLPDLSVERLRFLSETGATIVWQRTLSGTHEVDMQGIPASGKKVTWNDMVVTRFEGEQIAEEWIVSELMGELLLKASQPTS